MWLMLGISRCSLLRYAHLGSTGPSPGAKPTLEHACCRTLCATLPTSGSFSSSDWGFECKRMSSPCGQIKLSAMCQM
ncbi:uncharacterized protein B0I36DRAFT_318881 [Microdochium trichocladiopsis]|uniref:Secreted protein n=1 Tax=Microdochium trichocladiopsis TaxID=1682393 RepID=A0A9P9BT84_9PEZI|nr:uncharacterized protein B0I36DRAFT_318881 [Microdochium trichocladiopsis]KAH7035685.1 hypothetical protein B0I36DRAFT_318881 [Microdochium trichocladiopsis]